MYNLCFAHIILNEAETLLYKSLFKLLDLKFCTVIHHKQLVGSRFITISCVFENELFEPRDRGILGGKWGHLWGLSCWPREAVCVSVCVKERGQTGHANTGYEEGWVADVLSAFGCWGKTVETLGLHPMCCCSVSELNDLSSA